MAMLGTVIVFYYGILITVTGEQQRIKPCCTPFLGIFFSYLVYYPSSALILHPFFFCSIIRKIIRFLAEDSTIIKTHRPNVKRKGRSFEIFTTFAAD